MGKLHTFTFRVTFEQEVTYVVNDSDSARAQRDAESMLRQEFRGDAINNPKFETVNIDINETLEIPFPGKRTNLSGYEYPTKY
jgi:hypothetical protein